MTVRFKIALTIFVTGALTALGVIATVLFAFQRFEHETSYYRANAFLGRVVAMYDDHAPPRSGRSTRRKNDGITLRSSKSMRSA